MLQQISSVWSWFGSNQTKIVVYAVVGLAIITAVTLVWRDYQSVKDQNAILSANLNTLESVVGTQDTTIKSFRKSQDDFLAAQKLLEEELTVLQNNSQRYREDYLALQRRLDSVDLDQAARTNREQTQNDINNTADDARRLLECATGSNSENCNRTTSAATDNDTTGTTTGSND